MTHLTKKLVLAFVAAVMMDVPCIARDESKSDWTRLPDKIGICPRSFVAWFSDCSIIQE